MNWHKRLLTTVFIFGLTPCLSTQAFTPTPEQLQQIKNMTPAQQQQMAQMAGIDLNALGAGAATAAQPQFTEEVQSQTPDEPKQQAPQLNQEAETHTKLALFGHNLFSNSFKPATDIPVPANYILGPGDTIIIQLYGKENTSHSLIVNREGQIQFPQIGPITLAALSFSQAQSVIDNIVKEQMIGIRASVTMGALRSIRVFVLGEVVQPGSFTVGSLSTMTNALLSSGGITSIGSLRSIQLKRQGQTIATLDLYDLLLKGDTTNDSRLLPGDVIFVPPVGATIGIKGAINRPAIYEIKNNATAQGIIQLSGGLKNTAHLLNAQITRYDHFGETDLININLAQKAGKSFTMKDGDILSIPSKLDIISNQVTLSGHIKRPGPRSWKPGLHFTDLVASAQNLAFNPDTNIAMIERFNLSTGKTSVLTFSPTSAWLSPKSKNDPILQGYDVIYLFNYKDQRSEQLAEVVQKLIDQATFGEIKNILTISGSVRFPGLYPLTQGMNTRDIIQLAGGLTESAVSNNGEITRYSIDEKRQRVVNHIDVDLDNTQTQLKPGDTLRIKQIPLWKEKETITITGEVMFPGTYSIIPGETLTQVLKRAGGFTPHAYPLGAVFSRQGLRDLEQQRLTELKKKLEGDIASSNANAGRKGVDTIDASESELLLKNLNSIKPVGRIVIDLPNIIQSPEMYDLKMEDGDALNIPYYKPSVTVVGEVQHPTSHFYESSLNTLEYIERSGGYKKHADEKRVYIVKANGRVILPEASAWFKAGTEIIQAGDTVVVPLETDKVDKLTVWSSVTTMMYQAALGAAAVHGL